MGNKPSRIIKIEERALQNSGRKYNLVLGRRVVGVDRRRGHAPPGPVNLEIQFFHVVDETVVAGPEVVAEVVAADDGKVLILFF